MSNIIVVGCGRVGSRLALMLSNYENNVCVIDRDPRAFASLGRDFNGATFAGVGYDEDVLMKAGIDAKFSLKGQNLGDLFPLLGIALPQTSPYALSGELRKKSTVWEVVA